MAAIQTRYCHHLGKDLYLFDSTFNEATYIHVRKLARENIPTREGISLTLQRCNELFMSLPYLDEAVQTMEQNQETCYRRHLGGNWYVTVQSGYNRVDIRKFWYPEDSKDLRATKKGVSLTFDQYRELRNGLYVLDTFVPELRGVMPCYSQAGHDASDCGECTPK